MKSLSQAGPELAKRMAQMSSAIEKGNRDTLAAALRVGKSHHEAVIDDHSGGDGRLSRMGRNGAKVGARYDIVNGNGADVMGKLAKTGPLQILANPTKPHLIPRQRARGRRRVIVIPGVGVRASARHPGTRGKDTWAIGRRRAQPHVSREVTKRTTNILRRAM